MTKPKYTFEIYAAHKNPTADDGKNRFYGSWYWRCRHRNGKIIADGAEGYSSKAKLKLSLGQLLFGIEAANYEIKEVGSEFKIRKFE
jgi:hypothetical protein